MIDRQMGKGNLELKDGEPCDHPGCLSHIYHPCEGCGRIAGRRNYRLNELEKIKGYLERTPIYGISREDSLYLIRNIEQFIDVIKIASSPEYEDGQWNFLIAIDNLPPEAKALLK